MLAFPETDLAKLLTIRLWGNAFCNGPYHRTSAEGRCMPAGPELLVPAWCLHTLAPGLKPLLCLPHLQQGQQWLRGWLAIFAQGLFLCLCLCTCISAHVNPSPLVYSTDLSFGSGYCVCQTTEQPGHTDAQLAFSTVVTAASIGCGTKSCRVKAWQAVLCMIWQFWGAISWACMHRGGTTRSWTLMWTWVCHFWQSSLQTK